MSEPDDQQFRDWLRMKLRARGMSIRLLAQRSGTSASTVSRVVRGERQASLRTAIRLVRVLGEAGDADSSSTYVWPEPQRNHPIGGVERALRADERLTPAKVRRIMLLYHALRNDDTDEDERRTESAPAAKGT
ncbi:MAG TPA: helix-turn-helix transcriptional regulator [Vicinamibacteria bacterium]